MCAQSVITLGPGGPVRLAGVVESLILVVARGQTLTLPDARRNAGLPITVKNTSAGSQTTVVAPAGQTIDGATTYRLTPALAAVRLESDGSGWWVVAHG